MLENQLHIFRTLSKIVVLGCIQAPLQHPVAGHAKKTGSRSKHRGVLERETQAYGDIYHASMLPRESMAFLSRYPEPRTVPISFVWNEPSIFPRKEFTSTSRVLAPTAQLCPQIHSIRR